MRDLLPCPFCGGPAERIDIDEPGDNVGGTCIGCQRCGACSPVHFDRKENLVSSWNDRTPLPSRAAQDVLNERARQVTDEGWRHEHDDGHRDGEMAAAAACYALMSAGWKRGAVQEIWPSSWGAHWLKDTAPRRDLVKAGALILAEIERLDRAEARQT